jgi:hypothetical protein
LKPATELSAGSNQSQRSTSLSTPLVTPAPMTAGLSLNPFPARTVRSFSANPMPDSGEKGNGVRRRGRRLSAHGTPPSIRQQGNRYRCPGLSGLDGRVERPRGQPSRRQPSERAMGLTTAKKKRVESKEVRDEMAAAQNQKPQNRAPHN